MRRIEAVAIGCSAGGIKALHDILPHLPADLGVPVIVVCHSGPSARDLLSSVLARDCALPVSEAEERAPALPGRVYVAPPDYHLLVEPDATFALSVEARINNVRPAIDPLLESAAEAWGEGLLAVLLTGSNEDGAAGMAAVREAGGTCIVQDPDDAAADTMPRAAITHGGADWIAPADRIAFLVASLCQASLPSQDHAP
ncbi:putative chemotaxis protein-glutamate methylesterase(Signal transduction response regulator, chemotaxis, protein-glutamate methylesterase,3-188) [Magnetospirillum sp. XM-1]|uniref:chemotaxis protein CheB n=1 Tax=Magnetospirillum sp. XM-1 TaxID=1663591 RepID=UPI00073DE7B7|nr:chemotaxis protein CheB [Magnetospirillum sp. XM-1]CUW38545.1 putative chemotaxis protein-glutamate methylesterase(Signal transduction response regulator, chemotaxis, protein-glutamate methylesterase,3-188) [Magnetospirillum sp. XM-1]